MDEISKRKGYRDFITLVSNVDTGNLLEVYETSQTVQSGLNRMKKWLAQAQVFYPKTVQTIRDHLEGICNYFISRTTSGVMEGINNKAKLIMRQGYGFTDFDHFRARLLASFSD